MNDPAYSYPPDLFPSVARDVMLLRYRNFHKDAKLCIENLKSSLQILEKENIPQHGLCIVTVNHYHRPGFGAQWIALAIAALVPVDMHWIMTAEFTYTGKWYERIGSIGSQILLKRIAHMYGFTTMPPAWQRCGSAGCSGARGIGICATYKGSNSRSRARGL